jgi:hypothetical protein
VTIEALEGKLKGLLPRISRVGELVPCAARDRIPAVALAEWTSQPNIRWLEKWARDIDQNGYSACTCAALAHAIMFLLAKMGYTKEELDKIVLDWLAFYHGFTRRGGVALDVAISRAMTDGYPIVGGGVVRITEVYDATSREQIGTALQAGHTVIFGADVHCQCMLTTELKPTASDKTKLSAWRALTRNSWGRSFGDGGFHYTDLTDIELETYGCGIFCSAEVVK